MLDLECCIFLICDKKNSPDAATIKHMVLKSCPGIKCINCGTYSRHVGDLIATVSLLDLIICPDSSVVHISAALDIPTISIYGPFPSELRTKYYIQNDSIDAEFSCAPCFTHGHKPCPNSINGSSPCFNSINIYHLSTLVKKKYEAINANKLISELEPQTKNSSICYIIGKGPSLDKFDTKTLKGNLTICINDTYKIIDNPDYIFYHDAVFLSNIQRNSATDTKWILPRLLNLSGGARIFCHNYIDISKYDNIYIYNKLHIDNFCSIERHTKNIPNTLLSKSGTIQSAIHFAYKLGCRKVFLVGIDGGYSSGKLFSKHFDKKHPRKTDVSIYKTIRDDAIQLMKTLELDYEFIK